MKNIIKKNMNPSKKYEGWNFKKDEGDFILIHQDNDNYMIVLYNYKNHGEILTWQPSRNSYEIPHNGGYGGCLTELIKECEKRIKYWKNKK